MAPLPSLPVLDPIVLQFPLGFDATFDARPPAPGNNAPAAKLAPGNSCAPSLRRVSFVRHDPSSEMGGDAAIPEPEPVSVPEAVTAPSSTDVPECITQEVVPDQVVTTTVPADVPPAEDAVVNDVPAETPVVENVETVEAPPPSPGIQKSTTVVITVPAEEAVEEPGEAVQNETPTLRRSNTTITVTVAAENPSPLSRKTSLAAPRTAYVVPESTDAQLESPRRTETMHTVNLEGGTSVTVTEAASPLEQPEANALKASTTSKPAKKVKIAKTTVTRVRAMSLWRRIIAKILRKKAEKKIQQTAQVDGAGSPRDARGNPARSLCGHPNIKRPQPETGNDTCGRHSCHPPRLGVDEYFFHDNAARFDVKNPANAEVPPEGLRTDVPQ